MTEEEIDAIRRTPEYAQGFNNHLIYVQNGRKWGNDELDESGRKRGLNPFNGSTDKHKSDCWLYGAYSALDSCYQGGWPWNLPPLPAESNSQLSLFD